MTRKWKPGDVALVGGRPVTFFENEDTTEVMFTNASGYRHKARHIAGDARLAVVVDPEDREQVKRLVKACETTDFSPWNTFAVNQMQAALRSLIEPAEVFTHFVQAKHPDGLVTAVCCKVWEPGGNVVSVGNCPECEAIVSAGWTA